MTEAIDFPEGVHTRLVTTPRCRCSWTGEDYEHEGDLPLQVAEAMDELSEHRLDCGLAEVRLAEETRLDRCELSRR
jgi:hypothetical protein